MTAIPKIFISEPINKQGMDILGDQVEILLAPDTRKETALIMIKDADAAILRATTRFDSEVIEAGIKLKAIVRTGVGLDNVDMKFAGEKGIYVCNTPGTNDETVAEHVVAMVMALSKQVIVMDRAVREQRWQERFSPMQRDVKNKMLGIIGLGKTGLATARFCSNLGMNVVAYDPYVINPLPAISQTNDLDQLFRTADFITLHCPSTPITHHMVGNRLLSMMKPGACLINASRGDLVEEDALVQALSQNQIAGAAIDVFEREPLPAGHPLMAFPNVILSPHVAGSTTESNERIATVAAQAVMDTLAGLVPKHICNLDYFPKDRKDKLLHDTGYSFS